MKNAFLVLPLFVLASMASCSTPGMAYKGAVRFGGVLVDSASADISSTGTNSYSVKDDLSSVEVGFGAYIYRDEVRKGLAEVAVAQSSYGGLDAIEVALGGRYFLAEPAPLKPYVSLYWVSSLFERDGTMGSNLGPVMVIPSTKGGVRAGLGAEYSVSDRVFVDASLRYLFPLMNGEARGGWGDLDEVEVGGFSLFLGVGFEFGK